MVHDRFTVFEEKEVNFSFWHSGGNGLHGMLAVRFEGIAEPIHVV